MELSAAERDPQGHYTYVHPGDRPHDIRRQTFTREAIEEACAWDECKSTLDLVSQLIGVTPTIEPDSEYGHRLAIRTKSGDDYKAARNILARDYNAYKIIPVHLSCEVPGVEAVMIRPTDRAVFEKWILDNNGIV